MHDKSFLQAMQDLQDRISNNFHGSVSHMLLHSTTAADATSNIQDEKMRSAITNVLVCGQIISLLALMRDLNLLDKTQYDEFTTYLLRTLTSRYEELAVWSGLHPETWERGA
jgi:hypothetical protein